MSAAWDAIVIGSGFGGAVTACRLAERGMSVLVLERGRRWQTSEYPRDPGDAWFWNHDDPADEHGWIDLRQIHSQMFVAQGAGVGGGSLIYANVSVEALPAAFSRGWPPEISYAELKPYYDQAARMLNVQTLPDGQLTERFKLMRDGANALGYAGRFRKLPLAVTFDPNFSYDRPDATNDKYSAPWTNAQGQAQGTCIHCGNCDIGCQVKAKNTLDLNYIPWAEKHGAVVRPLHIVTKIVPGARGYTVHYSRIENGGLVPGSDSGVRVIVACGSLGSTELLLACRDRHGSLPNLSSALGAGWSSNGDFLTPALYAHRRVSPTQGPTITCAIDFLDGSADGQQVFVEDGGFPNIMKNLLRSGGRGGRNSRVMEWLEHLHVLADPASEVMPWFGQSVDASDGELYLGRVWYAPWRRRLRLRWKVANSRPAIDALVKKHVELTAATGGKPQVPMTWTDFGVLVTPHPLGGCRMGSSATDGVVNHAGEVFGYPNLYVADGAVVPRAIGLNPSRTIAALSERIADIMLQRGSTVGTGNGAKAAVVGGGDHAVGAAPVGIQFTETMRGFWSLNARTFEDGDRDGRANNSQFQFTLTVRSGDVEQLVSDSRHEARMHGIALVPALSPKPLRIADGVFNLFVENPNAVETRNMKYGMTMVAEDGASWYFEGFKTVRANSPLDIWRDTSTLFITVRADRSPQSAVIGRGILHIEPADFAKQMTTLEAPNAKDGAERLRAIARFGQFFGSTVFETYGGVFARPSAFDPSGAPRQKRPLRVPAPSIHMFAAKDGVPLRLTRYQAGAKGPVMLCHGLGVSSLIFSLDTIDTNMVEYLCGRGYDVWLLDFRDSIELPASHGQWTGDDVARHDYPAAVQTVRSLTGAKDIQMVVHCWGSTTFFMAMLAGLEGVRSAVCSQVATHFITPLATRLKTGLHLPHVLDALGVKTLTAYASTQESLANKLFDAALRLAPAEIMQRCHSPSCHRITFMYAPLYRHEQLNEATHATLHETFGIANMRSFEHLATLANKGSLVDAAGHDAYLPHLHRLKLPLTFIHGEKNDCFLPESTALTYELLRRAHGEQLYHRRVIPEYGHIDCIFGKDAARDVFPIIAEALDNAQR